jgi:pyocin activator protein PrtN
MAEDQVHTAPTLFLLMAQYNGQTVVPLDQVCRDFFGHLTVGKLLRKALRSDIALPIVRIETSQKATAACILSISPPTSTSAGRRRSKNAASFAERREYDRGTTVPLPAPQNPAKASFRQVDRSHHQYSHWHERRRREWADSERPISDSFRPGGQFTRAPRLNILSMSAVPPKATVCCVAAK